MPKTTPIAACSKWLWVLATVLVVGTLALVMGHIPSALANEVSRSLSDSGEAKFNKKDYDGAMADFLAAIKADPKDGDGYGGVGAIYLDRDNNLTEAQIYFIKAYELNPTNCLTIGNLASNYYRLGNKTKSLELWREKLRLCPGDKLAQKWIKYLTK